jgi:hypothetical protein
MNDSFSSIRFSSYPNSFAPSLSNSSHVPRSVASICKMSRVEFESVGKVATVAVILSSSGSRSSKLNKSRSAYFSLEIGDLNGSTLSLLVFGAAFTEFFSKWKEGDVLRVLSPTMSRGNNKNALVVSFASQLIVLGVSTDYASYKEKVETRKVCDSEKKKRKSSGDRKPFLAAGDKQNGEREKERILQAAKLAQKSYSCKQKESSVSSQRPGLMYSSVSLKPSFTVINKNPATL